jgi:hypothetical protein
MSEMTGKVQPTFPRFLAAGDCGPVVELGNAIDERINIKFVALEGGFSSFMSSWPQWLVVAKVGSSQTAWQ